MESLELPPRPEILVESLRAIGYTLETALADVIDNSITAEASTVSIRFLWAGGAPWIAVLDNGHGMSKPELVEAMRFGSSSPLNIRSAHDLGRFGLGMKTASISQCRRVTVISKAAERLHACAWDLDVLAETKAAEWRVLIVDGTIEADPVIGPLVKDSLLGWKSGTIVVWQQLDGLQSDPAVGSSEQRFSEAMDRARRHMELVFHRFLVPEPGRRGLAVDFNGSPLVAFDPFGPRHPARQELPLEVIWVNGKRVDVQPYVLPHHSKIPRAEYEAFGGEEGYLQTQGFYVYRNRRLIVKGTWFRLIRKEELNKLVRVRVDIPNTLDHLWRIDVKKSQAHPPESVLRELGKVVRRIAGAGRRVYTTRATRIQQQGATPVWKREVVDASVRYVLNEEHPLLRELLNNEDPGRAARVRACFRLISSSFPLDLYYSDAANDDVEFGPVADEAQIIEVVKALIETLRSFGFEGDELRRQLRKTEAPELPSEILERLLQSSTANA